MSNRTVAPVTLLFVLILSTASLASAQQPATPLPRVDEVVQVTATRLPETPSEVPANVEVFTGDELRARGATDLASALALAAGVSIAQGGDGGPAGAVPEFWGLKEFDAFLLVVDGVPWGGAFNPALTLLSLADVERIEVQRGPAPVMYGATSFVGVIQVVHTRTASDDRALKVDGGTYASGGFEFATKVPLGSWDSRLTVDVDRQGFKDDRTSFNRSHLLWRATGNWGAEGHVFFGVDGIFTNQDPASPRPREGATLSAKVPVDANHNPDGAFLDDRRITVMGGFDRPAAGATWSTMASFASQQHDILRGFLAGLSDTPDNARGLRETIELSDLYVDSHLAWTMNPKVRVIAGGDLLFGEGKAEGATFDYTASVDGSSVPHADVPASLDLGAEDKRVFFGGYAQAEWHPAPSLRVDAGIRLNVTNEEREGEKTPGANAAAEEGNKQTNVRPSGSAGLIWTAWSQNADYVRVFGVYRNTFKPAAFDFGLAEEAGGEEEALLDPETSQSVEGGVRTRVGIASFEASAFQMDFTNLVMSAEVNGLPALINGGTSRFKGFEASGALQLPRAWTARATYAFHDARFKEFEQDFDGVLTSLNGKRLEMSARQLASVALFANPAVGVLGGIEYAYTGNRYLNKRNSALAPGFSTLALAAGYRTARWEARVDGRNLTDRRDPVAESELGDAQYYLVFARSVVATFRVKF